MPRTRVVVTGVGAISPLGLNAADHFRRWLSGESAVRVSNRSEFGKQVPQLEARISGFDRHSAISNRMLRKLLSRGAGFAVGAAGEAIADAGLQGDKTALERCGLYVGSLSLEIDPELFLPPLRASLNQAREFDISLFAQRGMKLLDPLFLVRALPNAGICGISVEHQILGPNTNITNGTTSGLMAICLAMSALLRGEVDCALAGGYDTLLGIDCMAEHLVTNKLSRNYGQPERACRPFEQGRDGYGLGEGAAFVMLESAEHARKRGARIYGELLGWGHTTDTSVLGKELATDGVALEQATRQALEMCGSSVVAIDVVYGDGFGTEEDDLRESAAMSGLFGSEPRAFSAATSALGFTGSGSGAFSLIHAMIALYQAVTPRLVHVEAADPRCSVHLADHLTRGGRQTLIWNSERGIKNMAILADTFQT